MLNPQVMNRKEHVMQLVYVFDYCQAEGYIMRVPRILARLVCWATGGRRTWDFAPNLPLSDPR